MDDKSKKSGKGAMSDKAPEVIQPDKPETPVQEAELSTDSEQPADKPSGGESTGSPTLGDRFGRVYSFLGKHNLYFVIFLLLLLISAGIIVAAVKFNKSPAQKTNKTQSLTDQQLAQLRGSTTVVGDTQTVLDVQSNAVFESSVLLRNNLEVAGSIKVGGPLSLSAVTVGGTSSFGDVGINGNLTVAGQANFQKGLSVGGVASFNGTLSASQLNVGSLNLTGDLQVSRHITLGGGVPSRSNGSALGGGGTASINGSDTAGTVTINTGSGPPAGCFVTISFTNKFNSTPHVIISPANSNSGNLNYYANRDTTQFSVCTTNAPSASTTYLFDYMVID